MSRTDEIVERVRDILSDAGARAVRPGRILQELGKIELDVARRALCIEREDEIRLKADVATYVLIGGIYKITLILPPADWTNTIEVVQDKEKWLEIERDTSLTGLPRYVTVWKEKARFRPAPGSGEDGDKVTLWSFGSPTKKLVEGSNPETPEEFDNALTFGTAAVLLRMEKNRNKTVDVGDWGAMYEAELTTRATENLKGRSTQPIKRDHSSRNLRF